MRHRDIGELNGPIVLFGGPYSNLHALQAMLDHVGTNNAICTGDVVAYGGAPSECVDLLRGAAIPVVAGNCERQLAAGAQDCGCGFEDGSACDLASRGWFAHATARITQAQRDWMDQLPDLLTFRHAGRRFAVLHAGASANNIFLWSVTDTAILRRELAALQMVYGPVDGLISGHSGIALQRSIDGVDWINAGVIGLPPNDGDPRTEYAVLNGGNVTFHRLSYDYHAAASAMEAAGLVQGYEKSLRSGYWPNEDILPDQLRVARASG